MYDYVFNFFFSLIFFFYKNVIKRHQHNTRILYVRDQYNENAYIEHTI